MPKTSAGLLLYRRDDSRLEVLLVHPGGPFWARKDEGAWSIPKGELNAGEEPLAGAKRECAEELGQDVDGRFIPLTPVKQAGGKTVISWAVEADFDARHIRSGTFSMEWPPRSGRQQSFPEVDRADWFDLDTARRKILVGQRPLLDELEQLVG